MPLWFHEQLRKMFRSQATAPPAPEAAKRKRQTRAQVVVDVDALPNIISLADYFAGEEEGSPGFNTEAERLEARAQTIAAIQAIGPQAKHRQRKVLARLYEIPRLRQITGNLVELDTDFATAISADDFIAHEVSAMTALDAEILAPRKEPPPRRRERTATHDRRDVGAPREGVDHAAEDPALPTRRSSRRG